MRIKTKYFNCSTGYMHCLTWLLFANSAAAQVMPTGSIEGLVTDPAGAVVADAEIRLINIETGVTVTSRTNAAGLYTFSTVRAGRYRIEVSHQGFKTIAREFEVQTGVKTTIDIRLELGEVTQTVEVTDQAPVLETGSASLGGTSR